MRFILTLVVYLCLSLLTSLRAQAESTKPTIVTLAPHLVELLYDIGAGEQIIATTEFSDFPEEAKAIPVIGNYLKLNLEGIVAFKPDIILAWRDGNPAVDLAKLKSLGFRIAYSNPESMQDIAKELLWLGDITGNQASAKMRAASFSKELDALQDAYLDKQEISVFYELWGNPLTTIGPNSWPAQLLKICGAKNAFNEVKNDYPQINIEQVLGKHVDVIIQPLSVNQTDKTGYPWQDWEAIKAVEYEQIIRPNADKIHRMTSRTLEELKLLCSEIDASRQFYQQLPK